MFALITRTQYESIRSYGNSARNAGWTRCNGKDARQRICRLGAVRVANSLRSEYLSGDGGYRLPPNTCLEIELAAACCRRTCTIHVNKFREGMGTMCGAGEFLVFGDGCHCNVRV